MGGGPHTLKEIEADWKAGLYYYRRLEAERRTQIAIRQEKRKLFLEELDEADPVMIDGEWFVAGLPWRLAWLTSALAPNIAPICARLP